MKKLDVKKKKRKESVGVTVDTNSFNDKERLAFLNTAYICEEVAKLLRDCSDIIHKNYDSVYTEDDDTNFFEDLEDLQNSSGPTINTSDISAE